MRVAGRAAQRTYRPHECFKPPQALIGRELQVLPQQRAVDVLLVGSGSTPPARAPPESRSAMPSV